jgi:hypothetical protein
VEAAQLTAASIASGLALDAWNAKHSTVRRVAVTVGRHREDLLEAWERIHGDE